MGRNIMAWVLIVLGLTAFVGGAGMGYIFWIMDDAAAKSATTQSLSNPVGEASAAPHRSGSPIGYALAALFVFGGLILTFVGVGQRASKPHRGPGKRKQRGKHGTKQECPACSGLSPKNAQTCYQCGQSFSRR